MDSYLSELTTLLSDRQKIDRRVAKVEKVLRGMIDLLDEEEQTEYIEKLEDMRPPAGLTEAIQQVLASDPNRTFFPTDVRDRVKSYLLNHSNPMASVHTTLKRIARLNPMVKPIEIDGKTGYRWETPGERMVQDMIRRTKLKSVEELLSTPRKTLGQRMAGNKAFFGEK